MPKATEKHVLDLLRRRHVRSGTGSGEYAFMTHVRNAAAFDATRTFDAVAVSLWPSRGLSIHVFEVKCSRSDWLRELKEPAKAEAAALVADKFSIVAADRDIIEEGELPDTWGLLVVNGGRLVCKKAAPLLGSYDVKAPPPVKRTFLVPLLRAGGAVPQSDSEEVRQARADAREAADDAWRVTVAEANRRLEECRSTIREFEKASGCSISSWAADPAKVGAALRAVLDGDDRIARELARIAQTRDALRSAADKLDALIGSEGA